MYTTVTTMTAVRDLLELWFLDTVLPGGAGTDHGGHAVMPLLMMVLEGLTKGIVLWTGALFYFLPVRVPQQKTHFSTLLLFTHDNFCRYKYVIIITRDSEF